MSQEENKQGGQPLQAVAQDLAKKYNSLNDCRYRERKCIICGKAFRKQWPRHWKRQHPGRSPQELQPGQDPEEPNFIPISGKFQPGDDDRRSHAPFRDKMDSFTMAEHFSDHSSLEMDQTVTNQRDFVSGIKLARQNEQPFKRPKMQASKMSADAQQLVHVVTQEALDSTCVSFLINMDQLTDSDQTILIKVFKFARQFTQENVGKLIRAERFGVLSRLLTTCTPNQSLDEGQLVGLCFAMIALGNQTMCNLPRFLSILDEEVRDSVLNQLRVHLRIIYQDYGIIGWLVRNWQYLTSCQVRFIAFLNQKPRRFSVEKLQASRICAVGRDFEDFDIYAEMLCETPLIDILSQSLANFPEQTLLSEQGFQDVVAALTDTANTRIIKPKVNELLEIPITSWLPKINEIVANAAVTISTNDPVIFWIKDIGIINGKIQLEVWQSCIKDSDGKFKSVFDKTGKEPTTLQRAIGVYAISTLQDVPNQFWTFPVGYGKSYIIAVTALTALLYTDIEDVHIVICNKHLRRRDQEEFSGYWTLIGKSNKVHYEKDLKFKSGAKSLILMDEADHLLWSDPETFFTGFAGKQGICFTASTSFRREDEIDRQVLEKAGFKMRQYWPESLKAPRRLNLDEDLKLSSLTDGLEFIKTQLEKQPVLLFCHKSDLEIVKSQNLAFTRLDHFEDYKHLRRLDHKTAGGLYEFLIATHADTMRGTDLRARSTGMTLVVAKSFNSERDVQQGLGRVGRFGDAAFRLKIKDVELCNKEQDQDLWANLFEYAEQQTQTQKIKTQVTAKPTPGKKRLTKLAVKEAQEKAEGQQSIKMYATRKPANENTEITTSVE